jgi:hypothetical protein
MVKHYLYKQICCIALSAAFISLINAPLELYFCDDDFKTIRSFPRNYTDIIFIVIFYFTFIIFSERGVI